MEGGESALVHMVSRWIVVMMLGAIESAVRLGNVGPRRFEFLVSRCFRFDRLDPIVAGKWI